MHKSSASHRDAWKDVPGDQRFWIIGNWLHAVEQARSMRPMIYPRQNFIEPLLGDEVKTLATSGLWIAHYKVAQPSTPSSWTSWTFWQYSETGSVDGVRGNVDWDRFGGSRDELQNLTKS